MVMRRPVEAASLPPTGLNGMRPEWSRLVSVVDSEGISRTWHVLDTHAQSPLGDDAQQMTLLCVHGNPSWSFLWRNVVAQAPANMRVVAVDHLGMGFSERCGTKRNLGMRVDDLCRLTNELGLSGPVATLAHDWGGPISLGWALKHLPSKSGNDQTDKPWLAAVILTNTAVHQPEFATAPSIIRFIRTPGLLRPITVTTRAFIKGAINMSYPALSSDVQTGLLAPYQTSQRRSAIYDFVADIPLDANHESAQTLSDIAQGMGQLAQIPSLLLWGARDKVFSDLYLHDLERRLPHADVHRFPKAGHFVSEDADVSGAVHAWLSQHNATSSASKSASSASITSQASESTDKDKARALACFSLAQESKIAIVESGKNHRFITFGDLAERVHSVAAGMQQFGIQTGERVAIMVMPGVDLALAVYACWRMGAAVVLVDSGLGREGMQAALRSANADYLVGINKALVAARLLKWPGKRIAVGKRSAFFNSSLGVVSDLESLEELGQGKAQLPWPATEATAIVAFTSGSTGPSKGVIYTHGQVQAQRDALMQLYNIGLEDRLVAAFAPFALYGPTMCVCNIVPDMNVTQPSTLTAKALADAIKRIGATLVFASPAALVNIVATRHDLNNEERARFDAIRLTLSAGAPVRASLMQAARDVFTSAQFHTPYGMTEVLPVANISLDELTQPNSQTRPPSAAAGVCVGYPVNGVRVRIDKLDDLGEPLGEPDDTPGVLGEIVINAAHIRHGYDRLWYTEQMASNPAGAHRSGDVGQLDQQGRLWVGGRLGHVICTADGVVAPVAAEQLIELLPQVALAAIVGVGPQGTQAVVAVVQLADAHASHDINASLDLTDEVRHCVKLPMDIAAVLIAKKLPVDRRHNSKIDRTAIAHWASRVLAGEKVTPL